eukprot:2566977-Rhodomonas_salina.1
MAVALVVNVMQAQTGVFQSAGAADYTRHATCGFIAITHHRGHTTRNFKLLDKQQTKTSQKQPKTSRIYQLYKTGST